MCYGKGLIRFDIISQLSPITVGSNAPILNKIKM